jgi:hypothetical protein
MTERVDGKSGAESRKNPKKAPKTFKCFIIFVSAVSGAFCIALANFEGGPVSPPPPRNGIVRPAPLRSIKTLALYGQSGVLLRKTPK